MKYKVKDFLKLRLQLIAQAGRETKRRIKRNPIPTEIELFIGAFVEELEPQIRDAIVKMHQKGYSTESSGFAGDQADIQMVDGYFSIDTATKNKLKKIHVAALKSFEFYFYEKGYSSIRFWKWPPDAKVLKKTWDTITAILPKKKRPAEPSMSSGADDFRKKFAPSRFGIEARVIKRKLKLLDLEPGYKKNLKLRLKQIESL